MPHLPTPRAGARRAVLAAGVVLAIISALFGLPPAGAGAARAAAAAPGASGSGTPSRAALVNFGCVRALDPPNRTVAVQAVMRPVAGTRAMAMRIELLARVGAERRITVARAGDLGVWISPTPADLGQRPADVWRLDKTVVNLDAPAAYWFRVSFRWTGERGRVLARVTRSTRTCRQPELRPDLLVRSLVVAPVAGDPRHDLYTAVIADRGRTGAGPFEVLFAPGDSSAPSTDTIGFLRAGESRQLQFTGPLCNPAAPPTVIVDAARQVDDLDRTNNSATAVCPA